MKKYLILILLMILIFTGCSYNRKFIDKRPEDYKIILILPGPMNDKGWNTNNYLGSRAANEKLGTKIEYIENMKKQDFEDKLREYGELKYDLILVAGYQFEESVTSVAPKYPRSLFVIINGTRAEGKNVAAIFPKEYEASFIASIVAGNITNYGKFGTIGDYPKNHVEEILDTYEKNVIKISKERKISSPAVTRVYSNSWDNIELGRLIAEQMISSGIDTIFTYSHDIELGVFEVAKEKGVKTIGFSHNLTEIAPQIAVASINMNYNQIYIWTINQFLKGKLVGNKIHEIGIKEGIFQEYFSEDLDKDIVDKIYRKLEEYKSE